MTSVTIKSYRDPVLWVSVAMTWSAKGSTAMNLTTESPLNVSTTALHGGPVTFNIADTIPQIVLTMIIVAVAIIIGIIIGKLAEWFYDRHMANRDDISDMSEHTREILKANVARMKRKKDDNTEGEDIVDFSPGKKVTLLSVWSNAKRTSIVAPSPRTPDIEEADDNGNSKTKAPEIQVTNMDDCDSSVDIINETENVSNGNETSGQNVKPDDVAKVGENNVNNESDSQVVDIKNAKNESQIDNSVKLVDVESETSSNETAEGLKPDGANETSSNTNSDSTPMGTDKDLNGTANAAIETKSAETTTL